MPEKFNFFFFHKNIILFKYTSFLQAIWYIKIIVGFIGVDGVYNKLVLYVRCSRFLGTSVYEIFKVPTFNSVIPECFCHLPNS